MQGLAQFLGIELSPESAAGMTKSVSKKSIGAWERELSKEDAESIQPILATTLAAHRYR
jgi:hypothetical protein